VMVPLETLAVTGSPGEKFFTSAAGEMVRFAGPASPPPPPEELDEEPGSCQPAEVPVQAATAARATRAATSPTVRQVRTGMDSRGMGDSSGVGPENFEAPEYVPAKAVVQDIELFDANFFDYSPREAEMLDPQHRVMLECAVEAFEHAGYNPQRVNGRVGVYAG